jgi:hypothetical protein
MRHLTLLGSLAALLGGLGAGCHLDPPGTWRQGSGCSSTGAAGQCPPGQTCSTDGLCLVVCDPQGACAPDPYNSGHALACGTDHRCRFTCDLAGGVSCPSGERCGSDGFCVNGGSGACSGNCPTGEACDPSSGVCRQKCTMGPGSNCPVGQACSGTTSGNELCLPVADGGVADSGGCTQCPSGCVDISKDPANCGGCGNQCPVGDCQGGRCTALLVPNAQAVSLSLDDTDVFWADSSADKIYRCAKSGCAAPTSLVPGYAGGPTLLIVDPSAAGKVYWGGSGGLLACPKSGCSGTPATVVSNVQQVQSLVIDDTDLWASAMSNGFPGVKRCALANCSAGLADFTPSGLGPMSAVVVDTTNVYWTTGSKGLVQTCPKTGCSTSPGTVASGEDSPTSIAISGNLIYWLDGGSVRRCTLGAACAPEDVATFPSSSTGSSEGLIVQPYGVYWVQQTHLDGCVSPPCGTSWSSPFQNGNVSSGIAADAQALYFVSTGPPPSGLWRLPRP